MKRAGRVAMVGCLAMAFGCSEERTLGGPACPSWVEPVSEDLGRRCVECHGGTEPAGGYSLTSYLGALGSKTGGRPNAIAGDASSELVRVLDPESADEIHAAFSDLYPEIRDWVASCDVAYSRSAVHAPGILDPDSSDFHEHLLVRLDYNLDACLGCHRKVPRGARAGEPCATCHEGGPTACDTCHGTIDRQGAHRAHLEPGALDKRFDCSACHVTPDDYLDVGHLFLADGSVDPPPAEISFGALAKARPPPSEDSRPPSYHFETHQCRDVYCHGGAFEDTAAAITSPSWSAVPPGQAACGTCHGLPPSSHAADGYRCGACHSTVATSRDRIVDLAAHLDGEVDVGRGLSGCSSCHGSRTNAAPPVDLSGRQSTDFATVGAHQSHLKAPLRLRGPIACSDCHRVPGELHAPGHIDTGPPAEVFPPGAPSLARAGGADPVYDPQTATCRDVYCHGGGTGPLAADRADGLLREPGWTRVGDDQVACGTCHGVPPDDGTHSRALGLSDCATCHPGTVNEYGSIIVSRDGARITSLHINGVVDVR